MSAELANTLQEASIAIVSYLRVMTIPLADAPSEGNGISKPWDKQPVKVQVYDGSHMVFEKSGPRTKAMHAAIDYAMKNYNVIPREVANKWTMKPII